MNQRTTIVTTFSLVLCAAAFSLFTAGCEETKNTADSGPDSGITPIPPGPDGGSTLPFDCVKTPTTAVEILNQCPPEGTDFVNKQSSPPLLLPDGTLPPLP